jgi:hypothetical protein
MVEIVVHQFVPKMSTKKFLSLKEINPKTILRKIMWSEFPPKLPHYFPKDCFGGSSDLAGTGSTLFSGGLFWRQFRFGGNHNKRTNTTT